MYVSRRLIEKRIIGYAAKADMPSEMRLAFVKCLSKPLRRRIASTRFRLRLYRWASLRGECSSGSARNLLKMMSFWRSDNGGGGLKDGFIGKG